LRRTVEAAKAIRAELSPPPPKPSLFPGEAPRVIPWRRDKVYDTLVTLDYAGAAIEAAIDMLLASGEMTIDAGGYCRLTNVEYTPPPGTCVNDDDDQDDDEDD
jgi:hypothetical protein